MASHSARTMREVSETVVIYAFLYFWNKFLVRIPWQGHFKSGKSSVLQARNRSFVRRGFRRKVPFFHFKHKSCPRLFRTSPLTLWPPDCGIQVLPNFSEVLSAVFMCNQLPGKGNRVFNQFHCPSKVCVPAKEELFFVGFPPKCFTNSPRLWAKFCHLRRFSGTCCLEALFQALHPSA